MTAIARFRFLVACFLSISIIAHGQPTQPRLMGTSTFGSGSIFSLNLDGSGFSTHKTFSPEGDMPTGLTNGGDGFLYGMTTTGGSGVVGVIFKMKPDGSLFSVIHEFQGPDGSQPAGKLLMASNGFLYGMTEFGGQFDFGVLFRISPSGSIEVLKHFDSISGARPNGGLVETPQGNLIGLTRYGGSSGDGVAFSIKLDGSNFNIIHTFDNSSSNPTGTLLQLTDGLYGITYSGGTNNYGTIFKIQSNGSSFTTLHQFDETNGKWPNGDLILGLDNQLYGMTGGSSTLNVGKIFKMGRDGNNFTLLHDFYTHPGFLTNLSASLVQDATGNLYGTSISNPNDPYGNNGVLFKLNPDGSGFQFLLSASYPTDEDYPEGNLMIDSNGILYGVRKGQSEYPLPGDKDRFLSAYQINPSKIFSYDPASLVYQELKVFNHAEGSHPRSDLVSGSGDQLFGTMYDGGLNNRGVLFSINSNGIGYQALYHFNDLTGGPVGSFYRNPSGDIYGTTAHGKILYRVHENGTSFTTLHNFDDTPTGIVYYNGDFFGMTTGIPGTSKGYIFKIHEDGSGFSKLHQFNDIDGAFPSGNLTAGPDGTLYGMTMYGGSSGDGVIFKISPDGSNFSLLMEFDGVNGKLPAGSLLFGADGTLFGMSLGDDAQTFHSQVFNIFTDGTGFRKMAGTTGNTGQGNLIQAPSGELYGAVETGSGATAIAGYIFQINIDGFDFGSIHDQSWTNGVVLTGLKYVEVPTQSQTITFNPPPVVNFGVAPFNLTATASSNLPVSYSSSDLTVATVSGSTVTLVGVGTSAITASQPGNGVFDPATDVVQTLIVNKGNQVITFNSFPQKYINDLPFAVPASINSSLPITFISSDPSVATISGQTITLVGIGSTDITASQPGNANYNAASDVIQTLSVSKAEQAITFNPLATKTFGDSPFALTATSSSGLTVTYSSTNPLVATVTGNTVTITGGGSTTFVASQAGNNIFNPAPDVTQSMTVNKVSQTITFSPVPNKIIGDGPFTFSATSSSGLAVQYSTTSDKIITAGNQATIVKEGSVTVKADQPGNATYNPAAQVTQTFCINPTRPLVNVTGVNSPAVLLTSTADNGNQWYLNGNIIPGATGKTYAPTSNGIYSVNVTVDGCVSLTSAPGALIVTGDLQDNFNPKTILFFPNPARDEITVSLDGFKKGLPVEVSVQDLSGRYLEQKSGIGGQSLNMDIRNYPAGFYLIKASQDGKSSTAKFVKE